MHRRTILILHNIQLLELSARRINIAGDEDELCFRRKCLVLRQDFQEGGSALPKEVNRGAKR